MNPCPDRAALPYLEAAATLPPAFTLNDLTVALWRRDPERWSMAGYPQYPDPNRVKCRVYRRLTGLLAQGYLERDGWSNKFKLGEVGAAVLQKSYAIPT